MTFDPNKALEKIRKLSETAGALDRDDDLQPAWDLASLVDELDAWLSNGGSLPEAWNKKKGAAKALRGSLDKLLVECEKVNHEALVDSVFEELGKKT